MLDIFWRKIPPVRTSTFYKNILWLALSVTLILVVFQPFGTYTFRHPYKMLILAGYGLVIYVAGIIGFWLWKRLFKNWSEKGDWTVIKELGSTLFIVFICINATYFYHYFTFGGNISMIGYGYFIGIALLSALFPLAMLFTIRFLLVKNKLEKEKIIQLYPEPEKPFSLFGANKDEEVVILLSDFLFAATADNYLELVFEKDHGQIEKVLLRNSLTALSEQLKDKKKCQRVHRSFLVNMDKVSALTGKSPDYFLALKNHPDIIPVSRKLYPQIREFLRKRPI